MTLIHHESLAMSRTIGALAYQLGHVARDRAIAGCGGTWALYNHGSINVC